MTVYQHFREHEHPFVARVLSWMDAVQHTYTVYVTDFLDPRKQQIIALLIGETHEDITFAFFGGDEGTERKRAIIAPNFVDIVEDDFELVVFEARFPSKFVTLSHRDVLGAFTSLGIERDKIGDVIIHEGRVQLVTTKQLAPYVASNLTRIKQVKVNLKEILFSELELLQEQWQHSFFTVSSLRLDIIVKELFRISRKNAVQLIEAERVKVNFTLVNDPAIQLMEDDLISVRGYGRGKLFTIHGRSKKDKIKITAARLH